MSDRKIVQLLPADGWFAVYENDDGSEIKSALSCWALVRDAEGDTSVMGMDAADYVDFAEDTKNFKNYSHVSED